MWLAVGRDSRTGRSGNEVFGIDNFLAQPLTSPNGFMFGGTPYVMAWLIIRMIGRTRERRSVCGGKRFRGVASVRARKQIYFVGVDER